MQGFGLQIRYVADKEFALTIHMLAALTFVLPNEDNYIGRSRHNMVIRPPTFNIETWNMFHRTYNELPRTNSAVEG